MSEVGNENSTCHAEHGRTAPEQVRDRAHTTFLTCVDVCFSCYASVIDTGEILLRTPLKLRKMERQEKV
eukprot:scaffold113878_cov34-Prasinocladus_malaysianus.AAC.1